MNDDLLLAYLNDHLAGSVIAVEMGGHCRENHADDELKSFLDGLLREIEEDRVILKEIIDHLGGGESAVKKSAAWLTEKVGRLKTGGGETPAEVAFSRLEQLETLVLGIRGKFALWEVLEELSERDDRLAGFEGGKLKQTAADQGERVDRRRREAAREAFTPGGGRSVG